MTAALLAVLLTLAACGPVEEGPSTPAGRPPVDLVNLWRVAARGEGDDTWLRIDGTEFILWRGRGLVHGDLRASGAVIAGATWGYSGEVTSDAVGWLEGVHSYRWLDNGWQILDDDGEPLATMTIDGAPEPIESAADYLAEPPEVTDEIRQAMAEPVPLPAGLAAAAKDELLGRWVPAGPGSVTDPHVVFEAQTWQGSDGCNGGGGAWLVADGGSLLATAGPSTLIGCDGAAVPSWVASAARAGFDRAELVLVGRDGEELGRLVRD